MPYFVTDLFSHKIHSSGDEWPDKLTELAQIFSEFDGQVFDRDQIERRLQQISPRASYVVEEATESTPTGRMDLSKFRDEISAYPAYLGLYYLEPSQHGWIVRLSETAKRFLLQEEPDIGSFLRLQLPLFQYPNAMGARYTSHTNRLAIQANARDRTLEFVQRGVHFSPVRTIAQGLRADAMLRGVSLLEATISFDEIFGLSNHAPINLHALPREDEVVRTLAAIRRREIGYPTRYQSRFHTLRHTEMFELGHGAVRLRAAVNAADGELLSRRLEAICNIRNQFNEFDRCTTGRELEQVISTGKWGEYFDGIKALPADVVGVLTHDDVTVWTPTQVATVHPPVVMETYPFRERTGKLPDPKPYSRSAELADPETTRIKRQKRHLAHKDLVAKMEKWLRELGATPLDNDHIDLYAEIPRDGAFIFEMKSGGENLLDQVRKGLSQLYEYRYRYKERLGRTDISLCLVLPESPQMIPWIADYLCQDRGVNVCWFDADGRLVWPNTCAGTMTALNPENA